MRAGQGDPEQRFQTARDLKAALSWAVETAPSRSPLRARPGIAGWVAAALGVIAVTTSALLWRATRPIDHPLTRLNLDLGPEAMTGLNLTVAISPDGRRLVYPMRGPDGKQLLATRLLNQAQPTLLPGTENGAEPFFSPDGQWIGFFGGTQLKEISLQGGAPVNVGAALNVSPMGASWGRDGNIVAALGTGLPLLRIPSTGGSWQPFTKLAFGDDTHRWPQVLPDGGAVLFTASPSATGTQDVRLEAISLKTGQVKTVQRGGYYGRYLPSGHLVYLYQGVLFAVGFDPSRLEVRGAPVPLLQDVAANAATGGGQFDFSGTGILVYAAGRSTAQAWQVAWMDSSGKLQPLLATPGAYTYPEVSPDGKKLALVDGEGDLYVYDTERATSIRLTFTGHTNRAVWAPDGKHILFESTEKGLAFLWIRSDGSGEPQRVLESPDVIAPWSFSPGGRLAYFKRSPDTGYDLWALPLDLTNPDHPKPGTPEPFLRTPYDETLPVFSPNGRWIAYRSNESGSNEIYVRPFPNASGGRWLISSAGGSYALWSKNGRELFYETPDNRIMVVDYSVDGGSFVLQGKPRLWSEKQLFYTGTTNLDLAPDGKRFAVLALPDAPAGEKGTVHVTMLLNFFDELKRRIP